MNLTRRALLGMVIAATAGAAALADSGSSVVLFASDAGACSSLSTIELRKLFLGFTVMHDRRVLRPIRNRSDAMLDAIFLQHVVAMSEAAYERKLRELAMQQSRARPAEVSSTAELIQAFSAAAPCGVSFGWQSQVARIPGAQSIRVLWQA